MMEHEFEALAWVKEPDGITRQKNVTVCYELDGYKPINLWMQDENDADCTMDISVGEYDYLFSKACDNAVEDMACAAESIYEGER